MIEELADRIFDLQNSETHASVAIQAQIAEVDKKLNNLIEAMAQGIFSQATKKVLDDFEEQKKNLEIELFRAEVKNPLLTKEQILFSLYNYRKLDLTITDGRHRQIARDLVKVRFPISRVLSTTQYIKNLLQESCRLGGGFVLIN